MSPGPTHADIGGRPCADAVATEPEGVLWHAAWEPRVMALTVAMGATGAWNIDASRSARETLPRYAALSYYEIWLAGVVKLMEQRGLLLPGEWSAGHALGPAPALPRTLRAGDVAAVLARGAPTARPRQAPPRFSVGDAVRMNATEAEHHTRLPGYVRGRLGTVRTLHGAHVFADSHARGLGEQPQPLYTVAFSSAELWGETTPAPRSTVCVDAWESYMEPA